MGELEVRIVAEETGNYYNEYEIDGVVKTYKILREHMGFEDKRRDGRYIVKFHDIFYYTPEEFTRTKEYDSLFENFCWIKSGEIESKMLEKNISIDMLLHPMYVGHYQAFVVKIPEIKEDTDIIQLAMDIYDEFPFHHKEYIEGYIYIVNLLQELEDTYMDQWIDYMEERDVDPDIIDRTREKYHADMERRQAK